MLNGREADRPDVAVERSGSIDLNDSDVVLVSIQSEIPVLPYLRHREIQRSRLPGLGEIILAESHCDVARFVSKTTRGV